MKEAVFPFAKFPGVDIVLGPEMRSTGEVMGIAPDFPAAFAKSQVAASSRLPAGGTAFMSVAPRATARRWCRSPAGWPRWASACWAPAAPRRRWREQGIDVETVRKIHEGRPNVLDYLANGSIALIVNTPSGKGARTDEGRIRAGAVSHGVPCITTIAGARRPSPPWNECGRGRSRCMRCRICSRCDGLPVLSLAGGSELAARLAQAPLPSAGASAAGVGRGRISLRGQRKPGMTSSPESSSSSNKIRTEPSPR